MRRKRFVPVQKKTEYVSFAGGLVDNKTPVLLIPPGHVRSSQNVVERFTGGYEMFVAYERFSGQPAPSEAIFALLDVTLTGSVSLGDVVTDDTATAYGTVIAINEGELVLTKIEGTFAVGNIKVSSTVVGTCSGAQSYNSASSRFLAAKYTALAADCYREDIGPAPGSGASRGGWYYGGVNYCFRDNETGTKTVMYKESSAGWVEVDLGYELEFTSGGTYTPQEGDTITGQTSGATAVLARVVLESGSYSAGDVQGRFIFASQIGTFVAEDIDIGANLNVATLAGDSSAIEFSNPGGRFECITDRKSVV